MPGQQQLVDLLDAPASPVGGNLFGLSREQLRAVFRSFDQPVYRTAQLLVSMFRQRAASLDAVTTLPRQLREEMAKAGWRIALPQIVRCFHSADGTERYLMAGEDGRTVEAVWMPGGDSGEEGDWDEESRVAAPEIETKRATICVSSQMGCAVGCDFCSTAKLGLQRNLTAGEIAGQVIAVLERHQVEVGRDRGSLVFMGMGEPFV
jgi:23S rRNA (adenine2503-C2)-methyltransferase